MIVKYGVVAEHLMLYIVTEMSSLKNTVNNIANYLKTQKFFVLNSVVAILCFVVLPALIIFKGAGAIISQQLQRENLQLQNQLENQLDELQFFSSNDRFAHFLLNSLCKDRQNERQKLSLLPEKISLLKARYPDSFTFVIADKKGKILTDISDIQNFKYLYRKAFKLFAELEEAAEHKSGLATIEDLDERVKRLRRLLGPIIRSNDLLKPLRSKRLGKSILVSGTADRFHLWHGSGKNFRIIVFISRDFIRKTAGLDWACQKLNSRNPEIITGYTSFPPDEFSLRPSLGTKHANRVVKAVAEYENIRMTESKNLPIDYVACRFLNEWRGFAFYKTRQTNQIKQKQVNLVIDFIKILLVLIFVLLVLRLVKPISLTVKLKISAFFAYAIILPLLVISSIASQYIRQSEAELAGKLQKNSQRIIESIDAEFYWYKRNLEKQLKKQLEGFFNSRQAFSLSRNKAKALLQQINTICKPSEIMLIDETKKDHLAGISPRLTLNSALLRTTGGNTAKMLTMSDYKGWLDFRNAGLPTAKGAYSIQDRFSYLGVGELEMSAFIKVIVHAGENMRKAFFTLILWKESELNEQFIDYYIKKYLITNTQWQLAIYNRESEELFVSPFNENKSLLRLINRSIGRPLTVEPLLEVNNKSYMAVARPGKNLNKLVFSVLYPTAIIKQLTKAIWYKALLLAFFLCLLASATIYLLRSWIFVPLEQLKTGINAFANRQFNQQLEVVCSNELGNLISAFNNSLENLKELEVARIVQESILPNNVLKKGRVHVVAQTSTMTKLGGDYYDIVELDEERCLLLMGDATGHGIPAALSMAMAKAVLLHEQTGQLDQKRFMQQIHFLFKNLRKQGSKDLMTILCVELNYHTGKASLLNLGHCFPLLLKKNAAAAELLETISGLPPGFGNERKFVQVKLQLEPGDSLTLYTDGFVECCNEHSEPLGFRGLAKALAEARDEDPATHLKNLENKIAPWEKQSKDDKTIMIIKFL